MKKFLAFLSVLAVGLVGKVYAVADTLTGIDFEADLSTPLSASGKLAITAGVAIFIILLGIKLGPKIVSKFTGK